MMFITHIGFALLLGLLTVRFSSLPVNKYLFIATIIFASLLPDLDSGTSLIGNRFKLGSLFLKHRGVIHSVAFLTGFSIVFFLLTENFYYFLAFAAGYLSHLLLDSMTPSGVAFFWPGKNRIRGSIRTTGLWDLLIFFVLIAADILLMI
jgi:inner membrane protein